MIRPAVNSNVAGIRILVTRLQADADGLVQKLNALGACAYGFPVLEIQFEPYTERDTARISHVEAADLLIFVSVSAVEGFFRRGYSHILKSGGLKAGEQIRIAAIGERTARECERRGLAVDFLPPRNGDSEGLLEVLKKQIWQGKNVVIFRGQSGREWLPEKLRELGANVRCSQVYTRSVSTAEPVALLREWRNNPFNVVLITSVSILQGLESILADEYQALLLSATLLVASERIGAACCNAGFADYFVCAGANDERVLQCLQRWVESKH